ncbi:MAG: dihydropteroate synthase [Elusimicrobia bacterium]|nr:dihydropteroate synthase [Elusimicrobiota bacterium]
MKLMERRARLGRPLVMGIVNATGDSFFAASRASGEAAVAAGLRLAEEGADLVDVGGESTRPGSDPVSEDEESARVLPIVEALAARLKIPVSIDTAKAAVARRALDAGAGVLNDILALRAPGMLEAAVRYPLVVLMHMQGVSPKTMQADPRYDDCAGEVRGFLAERLAAFRAAGGDSARAWVDPGLGFGKTLEHNLELMRRLEDLTVLGPVLVGASRKSFLGRLLASEGAPLPPEERLEASLAAACRAAEAGTVCVRVHDVRATVRALEAWKALR